MPVEKYLHRQQTNYHTTAAAACNCSYPVEIKSTTDIFMSKFWQATPD